MEYQSTDASGAPVETISPLGYHVGWAGILFLNVSQMVGTGVFSTRKATTQYSNAILMQCTAGSILRALDSVGLSILYWIFGFINAASMSFSKFYTKGLFTILTTPSCPCNLPRVRILISKSFRRTGCLSGAGIPKTSFSISRHLRLLHGRLLVFEQQRSRSC